MLNSLTSSSSQRSYDHAIREFIDWYCSEPRLAFNETVVTRYRISLEQRHYASVNNQPANGKYVGSPTFRDTFSTLLKGNGKDVKVVQELLRHSTAKDDAGHLYAGSQSAEAGGTQQGRRHDSL